MKTTSRPGLKVLLAGAMMATGMVAATGPAATAAGVDNTLNIPLPDQGKVFIKAQIGGQQFTFNQPGRTQQSLDIIVSASSVSNVVMQPSAECDADAAGAGVDQHLELVVSADSASSVQIVHNYTTTNAEGVPTPTSEELLSQNVQTAGPSTVPLEFDVCA